MTRLLFLFCIILTGLSVSAQDRGLTIVDVNYSLGFGGSLSGDLTEEDHTLLIQDSELYQTYKDSFPFVPNIFYGSSYNFSGSLGLQSKKRQNDRASTAPLLRVGLSYTSSRNRIDFYTSDTYAHDTLVSVHTGTVIFVDSIVSGTLQSSYISDVIRLHAAYLFSTERDNAVSLYGGVAASVGVGFSNRNELTYMTTNYFSEPTIVGNRPTVSFEKERLRQNTSTFSSVNFPVGISFSSVTKHSYLSRFNFYMELRPGLSIYNAPKIESNLQGNVDFSFGIRVDIREKEALVTDRKRWVDRYLEKRQAKNN